MPPRPPSTQTSPYRHPSENPKDVYLLEAIIFDSFFKMRFALYATVCLPPHSLECNFKHSEKTSVAKPDQSYLSK